MKKHILSSCLLLSFSYLNCAQKPLRVAEVSFLIKSKATDLTGDLLDRNLSIYAEKNGLENVKKAIEENAPLKQVLTPKDASYDWKSVVAKIESMKKSSGGGAVLTKEQIEALPKDMQAFGERLKKAQDTDGKKGDKKAQSELLRTVLAEEAGLKSVQQYRGSGKDATDQNWKKAIGAALREQGIEF